ncbi:MAG TPA: right-handed parallel beta-helix repeat-containing protein [Planctomycetota bacterium]|nr:right-handed parallel beta-helix repeat-containing protein [Planctomycetota bacterium]
MPPRLVLLLVLSGALAAAEFHVAVDGAPINEGSRANPWDVATALSHPAVVRAGDTLWLHGGTYPVVGMLTARLVGTAEAPIVVRAAPGERVVLDTGANPGNRIAVLGAHAWYWGFEITSSAPERWTATHGVDGHAPRGGCIDVGLSGTATGIKLINLMVHDTAGAIGAWSSAVDVEIHGCVIWHNGFDAPDRGHGHGIHAQNERGTKTLSDNLIVRQYSHGIHVYGSERASLDGFVIVGNIALDNGVISTISEATRGILVGGGRVARDPVVRDNVVAYHDGGIGLDLGYGRGVQGADIRDNRIVARLAFAFIGDADVITGNHVLGALSGVDPSRHPDNAWCRERPSGAWVVVRPNRYEPGRAHIAAIDFTGAGEVEADVSAVLRVGDRWLARDAHDPLGAAVACGTYAGGTIRLPTRSTACAEVVGAPSRPVPRREGDADAFILTLR